MNRRTVLAFAFGVVATLIAILIFSFAGIDADFHDKVRSMKDKYEVIIGYNPYADYEWQSWSYSHKTVIMYQDHEKAIRQAEELVKIAEGR